MYEFTLKNHIGIVLLLQAFCHVVHIMIVCVDKEEYKPYKCIIMAICIFIILETFYWILLYFFVWN